MNFVTVPAELTVGNTVGGGNLKACTGVTWLLLFKLCAANDEPGQRSFLGDGVLDVGCLHFLQTEVVTDSVGNVMSVSEDNAELCCFCLITGKTSEKSVTDNSINVLSPAVDSLDRGVDG